ncbi:uncharacterized protein G2W53_041247 [Senna tora]|uniref:Uncharacterized protein n=1 Tax=Senna tora TaxID=362788 RepID=A0A834SFE2_9FABA|nr:uncharacterized protein G2W53_041247 [Senna tora]
MIRYRDNNQYHMNQIKEEMDSFKEQYEEWRGEYVDKQEYEPAPKWRELKDLTINWSAALGTESPSPIGKPNLSL